MLTALFAEKRAFDLVNNIFLFDWIDLGLFEVPAKILSFEIDLKLKKIFNDILHPLKNGLKLFLITSFKSFLIF